jgi:hypothetical protein
MSCPDGNHDPRAVNPFVHPTEKDAKGNPLEIVGAPPQSEEEPAWCRTCGALWSKGPFGWKWQHPWVDQDAPTLGNLIREAAEERAAKRVSTGGDLIRALRDTADRLEGEADGGLTGVALVVEGVPGVFAHDGPLTAVWVSMQGGEALVGGLRSVTQDTVLLRQAKARRVQ